VFAPVEVDLHHLAQRLRGGATVPPGITSALSLVSSRSACLRLPLTCRLICRWRPVTGSMPV
jgi:hypothetical protein